MGGLSALSLLFNLLFYAASAVFLVGFLKKIYGYSITPEPLKIPVNPAPLTPGGVVVKMTGEVLLFSSLFKGNKWTWIGGIVFHGAFALVIIRHLRYFLYPVPEVVVLAGPPGVWAGVVLVAALVYLYGRRLTVDRAKYISISADYFALVLIALVAVSGLVMKFMFRTDVLAAKEFIMGVITFSPRNIPADPMFMLHLMLVMVLMVYIPHSKLMHMGGIFFSPTRIQVDDARDKRHVNPWAA